MRAMFIGVVAALAVVLTACGSGGTSGPRQLDTLHEESFEAIIGTWPLTVDEATPVCGKTPGAVGIETGGTTYALNGTAETHEHWPALDPIWADNPAIPGAKMPTSDLLDFVQRRC